MKAIIAGAGIAGLAAAHALSRIGWTVTLIERTAGPRFGGYMIDFFGPGYDAAEALGILPDMAARAHDLDAAYFVDAQNRVRARLDYGLARKAAGGRLFSIMRGDIEKVLLERLPDGVDLIYGARPAAIENQPTGVGLTLADGRTFEADLLVGADGIHSSVRALAFAPEQESLRYLGYHTAAYFITDPAVRRAVGGSARLFTVPHRLAGLYDIGDGTVAAFFVHRADARTLPTDPLAALRAAYGDLGWLTPQALDAAPPASEIYYDVVAQTELPRWHRDRVVLIGDAAYAVSLLAGQGASLAIAGGRALGEALAPGEIDAGLVAVERRLGPQVRQKQVAGRRTAKWFVPPSRAHIAVRDLAVNLVSSPMLIGLLGRFLSVGSKGFSLAR